MNVIRYGMIRAITKGSFWGASDPHWVFWERVETGKTSYESASEIILEGWDSFAM